ncbi:MAG: glycosyltransferase family 2 protein, partial [Pseudonocardiaceae bacterium]
LPLLVVVLALPAVYPDALLWPGIATAHDAVAAHMTLQVLLLAVTGADLALTCVVALIERRLRFLLLWIFFPLLRVLDAAIALYVFPRAWLSSTGRWTSPARRAVGMRPTFSDQMTVSAAVRASSTE